MPTLIDLLDQYLFSDAPGLVARAAIQRAWEYTTANTWDKLYLASLEDALSEELPHLSAYSGPNTKRPSRTELAQVLSAELGEAGATLATLDQSSRAFLTELARAMQSRRLVTINHHNLFTDEYRQILLNLFDHAHTRFKSVLTRSEPAYSAALDTATEHDLILLASISNYLERQFGVKLASLGPGMPHAGPVSSTASAADAATDMLDTATVLPETPLTSETPQEDSTLEPLAEINPQSEPTAVNPTPPTGPPLQPAPELATNEPVASVEPPAPQAAGGHGELDIPVVSTPPSSFEQPADAPASAPADGSREMPIRLRVLLATPADVQTERRLLTELIRELDTRARARFGLELTLVSPTAQQAAEGQSLVELADIFVGVVWLQFGAESFVGADNGEGYFAGTRSDFARALEQGSGRTEGWLRTVIYRSIRPPLDLLHMDVSEYSRVQQFFERAGAYAGDDLVRVYVDSSELINDARARLDAWIYNYAGDLASTLSDYGSNSAANGQIEDALADYKQTITLYRELDRPEQELALWLQVGALQQSINSASSAEAYDTALRLARRIEDDPAAARALRSLGALDAAQGQWRSALDRYHQARTYLQPGDTEYSALLLEQIDAYDAFGESLRARGDFDRAIPEFKNALGIAQELGDTAAQTVLWSKLGALAAERGAWNDSLSAYDNALAQSPDQRSDARLAILDAQANAHTQLAQKARSSGDLAAAEQAYQSALRVNAQGAGDRLQRVALFTALGTLAADRADWTRSIDANEQALALLDSPDDVENRRALMASQALAYQELGAEQSARGDFAAASSAYRDALSLYQELDRASDQGVVLHHLGEIALLQAEPAEANAYFLEALPRLEGLANAPLRAKSLQSQAVALQNIGDEQRASGEWAQAEIAFVQARGNLEQQNRGGETGPLLYRLGVVTAAQSRLPEALAYFQQARTRLTAQEDNETRIESLRAQSDASSRFAEMYRGSGDFQSARAYYRQQLELAEELQDETLEADAYDSLGLVAADQGEWDDAVDLYDRALARLQGRDQETTRAFAQRHQLTAFEKIGERERAAHNLSQSELAYRSALALAQSLGDKEREADLLYTLGLLAIEHENWDEALVNLRRALGIYNLMPAAPNKPKVIFGIGRAQRGQKQAHLKETLQQAQAGRSAALYLSAAELARELGDQRSAAVAARELGSLALEQGDWDKALVHFDEALTGLTAPEDQTQKQLVRRAQLHARRERSNRALQNRQWGSADADLFVALDLAREVQDADEQGDLVYRRGLVAAGQRHWNQAIDLYSEALNRLQENNPERATVERAQAQAYQSLGDSERDSQNWASAEAAYSQALALRRTLNDTEPQTALCAALGDVAMRQGRWTDAIAQLGAARSLAVELADTERAAALDAEIELASRALKRQEQETIEQRGDAFRASHAYALAQTEYAGALELAEELEERAAQAELNAKLGFIATETGALRQALAHYRIAAGMYDAPENAAQRIALVELQAQTLQELGNQAGTDGAWQQAFEFYSQAVALLDLPAQAAHRNEIVRLEAVTCQNLAEKFRDERALDKALDQYRRAQGLYALVGAETDRRAVVERQAEVLTDQAHTAHQTNDFATAQILYGQAIERYSELQQSDKLRQTRAEQLVSFQSAGSQAADAQDIPGARRHYRQALGIAQELDDQATQAVLYHRLGQLAARQFDWEAALLSYQAALEHAANRPEIESAVLADQLTAYQEQATSRRIDRDLEAAESGYVRAYTNAQTLNDAARAGELAFLLGTLSADRDNFETALGYYDRALEHLAPGNPQRNEIQPYRAYTYQQLGDTLRADGQFAAAADAYATALDIADESGDGTRQGQVLYRLGLLEAAQGRWEPALDAYARAETRIDPADAETAALVNRDTAFASQALKRERLAAQLDLANKGRAESSWDDAAAAYRNAMAFAIELDESELRDTIRRDLVALYAEKAFALGSDERWDASRDAYLESLQLAQAFDFADDVAQRQDDLMALARASAQNGNNLYAQAEWDAANDAYNRTLEYAREFGDVNTRAVALMGLGNIAQTRKQWTTSKEYYEQARPLFVQAENTTALASLDTGLGYVKDVLARQTQMADAVVNAERASQEGRFDQAQLEYRTAFGLARELDDSPQAARFAAAVVGASVAQAHSFREQEDWLQAERASREALGVAREFDDAAAVQARQTDLVTLAAERAKQLGASDDWKANEALYREALAVAQEFDDAQAIRARHTELIALAAALTAARRSNQDLHGVKLAAQHQLDVAQEFGDLAAQADALFALGENARDANDLATARNYFLTAAQTYEQAEAPHGTAAAQHALNQVETVLRHQEQLENALTNAQTARTAGRFDNAVQEYQNALTQADPLRDVPVRAATLVALAELAFEQEQWQNSLDHYAAAGSLYDGLEQSGRVAELAQEQARVTRRLRMSQRDDARIRGDQAVQEANLVKAGAAYRKGLELAQLLDDPAGSGAFEISLGQIAATEHRLADAAEWYTAADASFSQAQDETLRATARTHLLATYTALGDDYSHRQDWALAHTNYDRALLAAPETTPAPQKAHLLTRLGIVAALQNAHHDAVSYFDRALDTLDTDDLTNQRGSILEQRARVWQDLGDSEMDSGNMPAAQDAYSHALADARTLRQDSQVAQVLHSLGLVRGAQDQWQDALQAHQESYDLIQDADLPEAKLSILVSLAESKARVGKTDAARQDYQTALAIANSLSDTSQIADIEFALGEIAADQERWQEALTHYETARAGFAAPAGEAQLLKLNAQQATAYARLGEIQYGEGRWSESQIAFSRALELDSAAGRTDRDGVLYYRRGNAMAAQEKFAEAIADYDRASVALADDDTALRDRTIAQLAFALQQQGKRAYDAGDLDHAEMAFTRARKMAEASDNFDQVANLWFRLGTTYRSQARHDEALAAFRRAYEFDRMDGSAIQQTEISEALAERLLQRGLSALESENQAQADSELVEALDYANRANNPQLVGSTLEALAGSAQAQGALPEAIDYYARAGKTFAVIEDTDRWRIVSQQQAVLLRRWADRQFEANEFADAENLYRRSNLLQQAAGDESSRGENHLALGRALLAQARFEDALGEFEQADAAFDISAPERPELLNLYADALEAHGAQALGIDDLERAQSDYTRAAAYRDELGQHTRAGLAWQQLADIAASRHELANAIHANEQALARLDAPETAEMRRPVLRQQVRIRAEVGAQQQREGDWTGANETLRRALALSQELGDLEAVAHLYRALGSLAGAQEHWDEAAAEYTHALDVYDELNQPQAQAATWAQLGDMYRQATQYDQAADAFEQARVLYNLTGKHPEEGAMWLRLGHVEGDRAEWDKALDQYQNALHLFNNVGARSAKPEVYRALERAVRNAKLQAADQAAAQGDYELTESRFAAAEQAYRDALALYQEADERVLQAQMQNQIGIALEKQARDDDALTHFRAALKGFEQMDIPQAQVSVLANIGAARCGNQEWNQAEASYRQALAVNAPLNDPARTAELYSSLGMVREAQGDWESAFDHYRQAVAIYQSLELNDARVQAELDMLRARRGAHEQAEQEHLRRLEQARTTGSLAEAGEILNTLGLLAAEDGRWSHALEYYREAVANFEHLEAETEADEVWRIAKGTVLNNIGDASQQIGAWNDADSAYTRALGLAREIGDRESEALLLSNLGIAAQAQQQLPRALDLDLQALESFNNLGDDTPRADLLERIGDLHAQLDQSAAAEASYGQALDLARQANESERISRLLKQMGMLAQARGADTEALGYYQEALTRSIELERDHEQQDLLMRQGALYLASGQLDEAERAHRAALTLATAHGDNAAQAALHTQLGQVAIAQSDWQTAIAEFQAALALDEKFASPLDQVRGLEKIGQAHVELGEFGQADAAYSSALDLAAQTDAVKPYPLWLARAALAEKQNRWQDAFEYLGNALKLPSPEASPASRVDLLFRHGEAAMLAHNWSAADTSFNDAMELANASHLRVMYGWGMNRLGLLSQAQRSWEDALENFQEAIEIFRLNQQPLAEAHVLNNIARLKLETNDPSQADLFSQAALSIAQAFGSNTEASRGLYTRGLAAIETLEFDSARQLLNQAIATDPGNWAAQLQLGNALLAAGAVAEATRQAETGLGQFPDWELGAQTQLTIAALYQDDTRPFKTNLKRARALLRTATARRNVSQEMLDAVESLLRALEGHAETALNELTAENKPVLPITFESRRFVKTALLALSTSPRRFKDKQSLVNYFSVPPQGPRKGGRKRGSHAPDSSASSSSRLDNSATDDEPGQAADASDDSLFQQ
ncbi:MAG: tetratricopeptide repeat protein [Anaerolineae bacterium]|nr:tetratricopeptide repeat protein [Anaerolineae bacterium]